MARPIAIEELLPRLTWTVLLAVLLLCALAAAPAFADEVTPPAPLSVGLEKCRQLDEVVSL